MLIPKQEIDQFYVDWLIKQQLINFLFINQLVSINKSVSVSINRSKTPQKTFFFFFIRRISIFVEKMSMTIVNLNNSSYILLKDFPVPFINFYGAQISANYCNISETPAVSWKSHSSRILTVPHVLAFERSKASNSEEYKRLVKQFWS